MKHLSIILTLCIMCASVFAQSNTIKDSKVKKLLKTAEANIADFNRDSVVKVYPIYDVFRKEECKDIKFDKFPTYEELEQFLDFKHAKLEQAFVQTSNNEIWVLLGKYNTGDGFSYFKSMDKDVSFFNYLESMKPDKIYSLFGRGYFVFEKDGQRNLYNRKREKCNIEDMYSGIDNALEIFNRFDYPRAKRTSLMIDYGK